MRLGGLFHHGCQGRALHVEIVFPDTPHVAQDIATPVSLIADQRGVFGQIGPVFEVTQQFGAG